MIPIRNIYFLLCYAWDKLEALGERWSGAEEEVPMLDMLASMLLNASSQLVRAGLPQAYEQQKASLSNLRGRILPLQSQRSRLRNRMQCEFDELGSNSLFNQILFASLNILQNCDGLATAYQDEAKALTAYFGQVQVIHVDSYHFEQARMERMSSAQQWLLHICQLIFENSLPTESEGKYVFSDFRKDPVKMAVLFEAFTRNFYRYESRVYRVSREHIQWQVSALEQDAKQLFPRMETDISLISKNKKIIIDAKFYAEALASNRFGTAKFRPPHLYQIFAYLKNVEAKDALSQSAEGILLYPTAAPSKSYEFKMEGHVLKICCIDLMQDWRGIKQDLLAFTGE